VGKIDTVLQKEKECYVCGTIYNLHSHHIFYGTANRKQAEKRGLKVWLCAYHHNMSNEGVHFNKPLDNHLKTMAQAYYEKHYGTRADFRHEFGRSYL
jgi:hypothetical protein